MEQPGLPGVSPSLSPVIPAPNLLTALWSNTRSTLSSTMKGTVLKTRQKPLHPLRQPTGNHCQA